MKHISSADILGMRSIAARADDYVTICNSNIDRMTKAYLSLQIENALILELARDAYDCWDSDKDAKVGKLLRAMLDDKFSTQYRPDIAATAEDYSATGPAPAEENYGAKT